MEFPAISPSNYLQFPTTLRWNAEPLFSVLLRRSHSSFKANQIRALVVAANENGGDSVSKARLDCTNQLCFDVNGRKGWIHFVGIGGCGLSALAMLALKQGFEVSGSDIAWTSYMDGLQKAGACLYLGHSASNMHRDKWSILPNAIVVSSAIPQDNVEILYAKAVGVPVYKRDYWLGKLTEHYNLIAISGSHGKTTTASMLAYVLNAMGHDVTAVVGAHVPQFVGGNILSGGSQNFVLEADEYDGCFLQLLPSIAVVTSVDWEHVDKFQDEEAVRNTFMRFVKQIRPGGDLIVCGDNAGACSLLQVAVSDNSKNTMPFPNSKPCSDSCRITTYGISSFNEWYASSIRPNSQGGSDYMLCHRGSLVAEISLKTPGVHNVHNSLAVLATVNALVDNKKMILETINCARIFLNNFVGVSRRFELIGRICGCHVYDDYAHHPTEVCAVIEAARHGFPFSALLVVFQPHTYMYSLE